MGISNYQADEARRAAAILRELGTPLLIHQPSYSMLNRWVEGGLLDAAKDEGFGVIAFSPLAQGVLTNKYAAGVPDGSRAAKGSPFLTTKRLSPENIAKAASLMPIARERGQTMAQMALAWVLRDSRVTAALIGASSGAQVRENVATLRNLTFSTEELQAIESVLG